ncbi:MAG: hypothetical protein HFJ45_00540 [Clostridia bacterium]|nr:hypothetical protein [Clostridia bacterium]
MTEAQIKALCTLYDKQIKELKKSNELRKIKIMEYKNELHKISFLPSNYPKSYIDFNKLIKL